MSDVKVTVHSNGPNCPDCGVCPGEVHRRGCDIEQCPFCGGQLFSCFCKTPPLKDRLIWTGLWPGMAECREFGWFDRFVPGQGWVACGAGEEGAFEDLNRLYKQATWDRSQKRFVRRGGGGEKRFVRRRGGD
jgi:hypothetical protein